MSAATLQLREGDLALALETSNPSSLAPASAGTSVLGVALARWKGAAGGWHELRTEPIASPNPQHDDLASCIERCTSATGVVPRDLRIVAVSAGPGGFTSVRIAIVAAKMIAETTGAACIGVPTADALATRFADLHKPTANFAIALASKNADAHVTCYRSPTGNGPPAQESAVGLGGQPGRSLLSPTLLAPGALCDARKLATLSETYHLTHLLADRFLPPAMLEHATTLGLRLREPAFHPLAVLDAALLHTPVDPAQLLPIYPREPEAVTKWRAMRQGG